VSISEETAESKGVLLLKCEVVPRAACMVMQVMAVRMQIETPQPMTFFHHVDARRQSSKITTVARYIAIDM
jgi:hypothetical protein